MFLGGGLLVGYLLVPQILHHSGGTEAGIPIPASAYDPARIKAGCPGECIKKDDQGNTICGGC